MKLYYGLHVSLLLIILVTSIYIIIVIYESRFIYFSESQHTLVTGRRKTRTFPYGNIHNHADIIDQYFMRRRTWNTSNLGRYLYKNIDDTVMKKMKKVDRIFKVLIWRHWDWLKQRHGNFSDGTLGKCSVDNCRFSGDFDFDSADAIVVHLQKGLIPKVEKRNLKQIWIMLSDESPRHTFTLTKHPSSLAELANVFNWSMTYRSDSDIPVPYGRTLPLRRPKFVNISIEKVMDLVPYWPQKKDDVLASNLRSNCAVKLRNDFIMELQKHLDIDVYGKCSTDKNLKERCPGHTKKDCPYMSNYFFYLVLENARCREYITEKIYQHAFEKGAIPVIMGPPVEDCRSLLPPNSFLHVDDFKRPEKLALKMYSIHSNRERLLSYHMWRNNFKVVGEHGYFGKASVHWCRICEALNYNDDTLKIYKIDDIKLFLDPSICS